MTREEAIEVIEQDIPCEHDTDLIEALEMAIKALEQEPMAESGLTDEMMEHYKKLAEHYNGGTHESIQDTNDGK